MARRRLRDGISTGLQTILGRLAYFFRMGQAAAAPPGSTVEPGSERLRTSEEILAVLTARGELPSASTGDRLSCSYVAEWYDTVEKTRVGGARVQIEASPGTPRSTIDTRARRELQLQLPRYVSSELMEQGRITMKVRRLSCITLPASS